jgi:hypothetical protein
MYISDDLRFYWEVLSGKTKHNPISFFWEELIILWFKITGQLGKYRRLAGIPKEKRTEEQTRRLKKLSRKMI